MIDFNEGTLPQPISKITLDNMRSGKGEKGSMFGFLGNNEDFSKRVREDSQVLQRLGVSFEQVSSALSNTLRGDSGTKHKTENDIFVSATDTHGSQTCPYENCNTKASFDYDAHHESNGMKWDHLSQLHPHLIGEHHFFEGRQSVYRIEPIDAILLTGVPVERKQLINEALNQLRTLGLEDGISLLNANNLFILCQDEPELPDLLNKFIDTIPDGKLREYTLMNTVHFLRYKTSGNKERFMPILDKVEDLFDSWSKDNKLRLQTIRRVLKKDTNYPVVAGVFLPDLIAILPEPQQKYLKEQTGQNDSFEKVISDGQEFWNTGYENLAKRKLERQKNFTEISAQTSNKAVLRKFFDNEFPDSFQQALISTSHSGWLFKDIEEGIPFCNNEYGSFLSK